MSERWLSKGFVIGAFIFFGLTFYLLIKANSSVTSGIAFLAAVVCALFGHIDRIATFKATPTSIEAKMREVAVVVDEAKATLKSLHELATMAGATLIDFNAGMGRYGGGTTTAMKDARRDRIIQSLKSIALDENQLAEVTTADREWVVIDYCQGIFADWASHRKLTPDEQATWDEFTTPWRAVGRRWPSPEECKACMDKLNIGDAVARDLLEDYRYYMEHDKHRRPEIWRDRDHWLRRQRG